MGTKYMNIKRACTVTICLSLCGCFAARTEKSSLQVGFVASTQGKVYLYTTASEIAPMSKIQLQYPGSNEVAVCCVSLRGRSLRKPDTTANPASDPLLGNAIYRYALEVIPRELAKTPFIGAAILGDQRVTSRSPLSGEKLDVLDEHSGIATVVDICLGTEGVNLFLSDKSGVKNQLYYGLAYGVTATCDPKLFESTP